MPPWSFNWDKATIAKQNENKLKGGDDVESDVDYSEWRNTFWSRLEVSRVEWLEWSDSSKNSVPREIVNGHSASFELTVENAIIS